MEDRRINLTPKPSGPAKDVTEIALTDRNMEVPITIESHWEGDVNIISINQSDDTITLEFGAVDRFIKSLQAVRDHVAR